jgi:Ca-activated chloride channel family protein
VAIAIALGLSAVTAIAVGTGPGDADDAATSGEPGGATTPPSGDTGEDSRDTCTDATTLGVPQAYVSGWQHALAGFEPEESCLPVSVVPVPSAAVALGKSPALGAWIPEDRSWITRTSKKVWKGDRPQSTPVARTPVVVATSNELDQAVGGVQTLLVPQRLGPLVRESSTFADLGDDSAGELRIALPDPGTTPAGALGFAALTQAATGTPLTDVPAYVNPDRRDLTTIKTEHRVGNLSSDEATVLDDLEPDERDKANLAVTTEQVALAHNAAAGDPNEQLGVGYLGVDLSMAVVAIDPAAEQLVAAIGTYVGGPQGIEALTAAGFRPAKGAGAPAPSGAIQPAAFPEAGHTATAAQVSGLSFLFGAMHQRISTLVVLDSSGSMLQPLPGTDVSKIDLVRRAARDTLRVASPRARAGLVTFRSDPDDRPVIRTVVPLAANGSRIAGELHSRSMIKAVNRLKVNGGTPLSNAVRDSYRAAVRAYDPEMINQVVVLSDGRNEDAVGSIGLGGLLGSLRAAADPERPVRIIAIGYGPDADMAALNKIVAVTKGRASWLQTVDGYSAAVQEALFAA